MTGHKDPLQHLETLFVHGQATDLLEATDHMLGTKNFFSEHASPEEMAEVFAFNGSAHLLRGDWKQAEASFRATDRFVDLNTQSVLGMAHLTAGVRKDFGYVSSLLVKETEPPSEDLLLPQGLLRDILQVMCARCPEHVEDIKEEDEVDKMVERWDEPNPEDPFAVAQLFYHAARFYLKQPESCGADKGFRCFWTRGLLETALDLYGTGGAYLSYRADTCHLISTVQEQHRGPAAALRSAEQSLTLWSQQISLDPTNEYSQTKSGTTTARLLSLREKARYGPAILPLPNEQQKP